MKTEHNHPKLKPPPRPLFSCAFFRHCTQTALSPTATAPSSPSLPPPPPSSRSGPRTQRPPESSSSSSSSSASHSFTQWRFPLPNSPPPPAAAAAPHLRQSTPPINHAAAATNLVELFHAAELQLSTGSEADRISALHQLERSVVPSPPAEPVCPPDLMRHVVGNLRNGAAAAKTATKILLALCLAEPNRRVAVGAGAVGAVVEVAMELEPPAAERGLAALELTCTVDEGAAALRSHALAVPVMVSMMGKMAGRGKEYAISALAVIYGGEEESGNHAPPEEVARAVTLAMRGECTARGRRKGAQLLQTLQDYGRTESDSPAAAAATEEEEDDVVDEEEKRRMLGVDCV